MKSVKKKEKKEKKERQELVASNQVIQYWVGIFATTRLQVELNALQKYVLETCLINPQRVGFEKLTGYTNLYSIRYSKKGRIILSELNDHLVVLAILENHEYNKVLVRNAKLWARLDIAVIAIKKKNSKAPESGGLEQRLLKMSVSKRLSLRDAKNLTLYQPVAFEPVGDKLKVLTLDAHQQDAISASLPAIVSGLPGSGKTMVALALLGIANNSNEDTKVLYVTQSAALARKVELDFTRVSTSRNFSAVSFKTYEELLKDCGVTKRILTAKAANEYMQVWFASYTGAYRRGETKMAQMTREMGKLGSDTLYQEFRIRSGYSGEAYCDPKIVGRKQSLFKNADEREWINTAYEQFIGELEKQDFVMADFATPLVQGGGNAYDAIFVDEAQDLSNGQVLKLAEISKDKKSICYFYGDGQSLQDDTANKIFMQYILGQEVQSISLMQPYRCSMAIMHAAKAIDQLRLDVTPKAKAGVPFDLENQENRNVGSVAWVDTKNEKGKLKEYQSLVNGNPDACVITHAAQKEEAIKRYKVEDYQVFTPAEIKGLQYKVVILYEPLAEGIYGDIEAALKKQSRDFNLSSPLSNLFVAITRAEERLIFDSSVHRQKIGERIKNAIEEANEKYSVQTELYDVQDAVNLEEGWRNRAQKLAETEREERAGEILDKKLKYTKAQIAEFMETYNPVRAEKVVQANFFKTIMDEDIKAAETWINQGASVDLPRAEGKFKGFTALYVAAAAGIESTVKLLLKYGATVSQEQGNGTTALHIASAAKGRENIIKLLLTQNPNVNQEQGEGESKGQVALYIAASNGCVGGVALLLAEGAKVNIQQGEGRSKGQTALYAAAASGCEGVVKLLIEQGAYVNQEQGDGSCKGFTALHIAACKGYVEVVEMLLTHERVQVNQQQGEGMCKGQTALYSAAANGHKRVVEILIGQGANVNQEQGDGLCKGLTALYISACRGHDSIVRSLLAHKSAQANQQQGEGRCKGQTALCIAAANGREDSVKLLIEQCINVNQDQGGGLTALYIAAYKGHEKVVDILLANKDVEVNQQQGEGACKGQVALYVAVINRHVKVVESLLANQDIKVNQQQGEGESEGLTAFYIAVCKGDAEIVEMLLASGCVKVNQQLSKGLAALYIAVINKHAEVIKFLLKHGANPNMQQGEGRHKGITALCLASAMVSTDIVEMLLANKDVEVNQEQGEGACKGQAALYVAANKGHTDVVKMLLANKNIEVNQQQGEGVSKGETALYAAAASGSEDIVKLLLASGANVNMPQGEGAHKGKMASQITSSEIIKKILNAYVLSDMFAKKLMETFPGKLVGANECKEKTGIEIARDIVQAKIRFLLYSFVESGQKVAELYKNFLKSESLKMFVQSIGTDGINGASESIKLAESIYKRVLIDTIITPSGHSVAPLLASWEALATTTTTTEPRPKNNRKNRGRRR